jgi:O-antigen ligase
VWDQALALARENALWGIGLDMTRHTLGGQAADMVHAHNFLLQTVLDLGLAGALAMLALLVLFVRAMASCWRQGGNEAARIGWNAGLAVLAFQVFGLVDAVAIGAKVGLLFWLSGGTVVAAHYLARREPEPAAQNRLS